LSFRTRHAYDPADRGIRLRISLRAGTKVVQSFAYVDTGAEFCVFDRGIADGLLIELDHGTRMDFTTVAGRFRAYGHEVTIAVLDVQVHAMVYFYEDASIKRNVLGRNGWLNRVRLGLVDYDSMVYVSAYDD